MPRKGYSSASPLLKALRRVAMGQTMSASTTCPVDAVLQQLMEKDGVKFLEMWQQAEITMRVGKWYR